MGAKSFDVSGPNSLSLSRIRRGTLKVPLNVAAGGTLQLGEAGTVRSYIEYFATTDPTTLWAPNTTALADNNALVLSGAPTDLSAVPTRGSYVGVYGIDALTGGAQNKGSVHIGTATGGSTTAATRVWFYGKNDAGGDPCASLSDLGLSLFKGVDAAIEASISPSLLTASRAFQLPDAAGTLMVSGGSGAVSLSNLTAGTLPVALSLPNNLSATAGATQILGSAAGIVQNVPLALAHTWMLEALTAASLTVTGLALSVPLVIVATANPDASAHGIGRGTFTQIYNVPTGNTHIFNVNAVTQQTLSVNGIQFNTSAGAVTAGTRGIYQLSTGLTYNVPTSTTHIFGINGSAVLTVAAALLSAAQTLRFTGATTLTTGQTEIGADASAGNLQLSLPNATVVQVRVNGGHKISLGRGIFFETSESGLGGASNYSIWRNSTGMVHSVPNNIPIVFTHNDVENGRISGVGLDFNSTAGNQRVRFNAVGTRQTGERYIVGTSDGLSIGSNAGAINLCVGATVNWAFAADCTVTNASNFAFGTGSGTKLGTATSQKLAFWNKTPIVQPTTGITGATLVGGGGATLTDTDTFGGYTVAQLAAIIINTGLAA